MGDRGKQPNFMFMNCAGIHWHGSVKASRKVYDAHQVGRFSLQPVREGVDLSIGVPPESGVGSSDPAMHPVSLSQVLP